MPMTFPGRISDVKPGFEYLTLFVSVHVMLYFCVWWFSFRWISCYRLLCVSLGLLSAMFISRGFDFDFLSTSQEIHWEECLPYDLFSVEWDVKS